MSAYLSLVRFEHTIFALPFAYAGMLLALHVSDTSVTAAAVLWVTLAMVGARTLAMALNRLIDVGIDARNPRTAGREIPSGRLSRRSVWLLCATSLVLLVAATRQLDDAVRWLWPIPVAAFLAYPYTKRVTWLCHLVLGCAIGLAAPAAWAATTGRFDLEGWLLGAAVALWIAGFDVIYATQDVEIDRAQGLHSIPARFRLAAALDITRLLHVATVLLLGTVGWLLGLDPGYWVGLAIVTALLAYENHIVRPDDLSRVNAAFFTTNGVIGIVFLGAVLTGI